MLLPPASSRGCCPSGFQLHAPLWHLQEEKTHKLCYLHSRQLYPNSAHFDSQMFTREILITCLIWRYNSISSWDVQPEMYCKYVNFFACMANDCSWISRENSIELSLSACAMCSYSMLLIISRDAFFTHNPVPCIGTSPRCFLVCSLHLLFCFEGQGVEGKVLKLLTLNTCRSLVFHSSDHVPRPWHPTSPELPPVPCDPRGLLSCLQEGKLQTSIGSNICCLFA